MIVEARYARGTGVLVGAGGLWLLMTDPGDEQVVQEIWDAMSVPPTPCVPTTERVLAIVEKAFDGDPPALAMVDVGSATSATVSRGRGHVRLAGPHRVLTLDGGSDPESLPRTRRLVGGVVAADRVELRPLGAAVAPSPVPAPETLPPPPSGALIDGIPADILAAKGPDGPPPRPRVRRPATEPVTDTGPLRDTTEPEPGFVLERILEGGHTTIRPPVAVPATPAPGQHDDHDGHEGPDDHDGATVHRPGGHLVQGTSSTVLAVSCPLGHLTPPSSPSCRTCHQRVAPQEPLRVPRPALGGLRLPTGEVVPLDRGVVLGRKPAPVAGSTDWPHLVHLPSDHSFVSRMHLQIELDGWDVVARDLDSRGGTTIAPPGRDPVRMRPRDAYILEPGTLLDLADVYAVRYETGPVAPR